jgi:hypothetical protein
MLAAISLLLSLLVAEFWYRSNDTGDFVCWYSVPHDLEIHSNEGLVQIAYGTLVSRHYAVSPGWEVSFWRNHNAISEADLHHGTTLGFRYEHWKVNRPGLVGDSRIITFPYWLVMLFFLMPTIIIFILRWRSTSIRSDQNPRRCPHCGYDLRATPNQCPECGTIPSKNQSPAT